MSFLLAKKKIIIIISAILALISLVTGLTTLSISSQKQLNKLQQFPTHLNNVIANSLQGKDSPYYKVFLISLVSGTLLKDDGKTLTDEFNKLNTEILNYHSDNTKVPQWTPEEINYISTGYLIWNKVLDDLSNQHLTYGATTGFGYFIQNLNHGITIKSLLNSPTKENKIIDTVLKGLLTEIGLPLAYKQVNMVNTIATTLQFPHPPINIIVSTPDITGIKAGVIILIIFTPILILLLIAISFSYYLYARKTLLINNWNKLLGKIKQNEKQIIIKPELEATENS